MKKEHKIVLILLFILIVNLISTSIILFIRNALIGDYLVIMILGLLQVQFISLLKNKIDGRNNEN